MKTPDIEVIVTPNKDPIHTGIYTSPLTSLLNHESSICSLTLVLSPFQGSLTNASTHSEFMFIHYMLSSPLKSHPMHLPSLVVC